MKLIRISIVLGMILAIPLCMGIYVAVDRLESQAEDIGEVRQMLTGDFGFDFSGVGDIDSPSFPFERRLKDQQERTLDTVVLGRTENSVRFLSKKDGWHYNFPIEKLSSEDAEFLQRIRPNLAAEDAKYPVIRRLTNDEGNSLVAVIHGRSSFDLFLRKYEESGSELIYPINKLSRPDRTFVFGLPVNR